MQQSRYMICFCRVTGYGGTTQQVDSVEVSPIDRMITINFDTNVASDLTWEFKTGKEASKDSNGRGCKNELFCKQFGKLRKLRHSDVQCDSI